MSVVKTTGVDGNDPLSAELLRAAADAAADIRGKGLHLEGVIFSSEPSDESDKGFEICVGHLLLMLEFIVDTGDTLTLQHSNDHERFSLEFSGLVRKSDLASTENVLVSLRLYLTILGSPAHEQYLQRDTFGKLVNSQKLLAKLIALFLDEIKTKVCKGHRPEQALETSATFVLSTLSGWLAKRFGIQSVIAYGLATAILVNMMWAVRKAFCKITLKEYLEALGMIGIAASVPLPTAKKKRVRRKANKNTKDES